MRRYTERWPLALTERDIRRVKEAAEVCDITAAEFMRLAIREKILRVLLPPPPRLPARQDEPARQTAA
jgi:hypothetical protein